jgi:hypothetical protein
MYRRIEFRLGSPRAAVLLPVTVASIVGAVAIVVWSGVGASEGRGGRRTDPQNVDERSPGLPLRIEPVERLPPTAGATSAAATLDRLRPQHPETLATMLHAMRLFGQGVAYTLPGRMKPVSAADIALDEDLQRASFAGKSGLFVTRYGVRNLVASAHDGVKSPEGQAHVDQLLAVLAETGVPLTHRVRVDGSERDVRSLLEDSLACFDMKQEIEWTALAYALYLPPKATWTDKFGRTFSFDDLADELLSRAFDRSGIACDGTHLLYSLTVLLRSDEIAPILSGESRRRVTARLRDVSARVVAGQEADGSWSVGWYRSGDRTAAPGSTGGPQPQKVLVTGHHIEWLLLLPRDLRPDEDCLRRGSSWLGDQLQSAPAETIRKNYCPYSHAGKILFDTLTPAQTPEVSPAVGERIVDRPTRKGG